MRTQTIIGVTTFAALLTGPAFAQSNGMNEPPTISNTQPASGLASVPVAPTGLGLQVGGGVTGFTRQGARDDFGTGGYWDARATLGTRSFLGAEVAYVGSARDVKATGVSGDSALLGNGAEAVVRGNLPIQTGNLRLEPFVFGGAGWTYYQLTNNSTNASAIKDHANAFVIPFGGGVSAGYDHFIVDARFTYRAVFDDKLVPTTGNDHLDLQNWSAGLTLGYEL
jgi:hypothetical protein